MLLSGGEIVLSDTTPTFARTTYYPNIGLNLTNLFATYSEIYRRQLWVYTVVRKRALATARLPLKVYDRIATGREEARDGDYARLLRAPNPKHDPFFFWLWTSSTFDVYGEAIWAKVRGRNGLPRELWPVHPSNVSTRLIDGELVYLYLGGVSSTEPLLVIPSADIVHFKTYNPDTTVRGLAPMEPLRQTLLNEDAARRASSAFWVNGARPSLYLTHPKTVSDHALNRLRENWEEQYGGVDKFGKTAILEEGMEPHTISLSAEESQYIQSRHLNREEVCGAYDVPPPVVHILDRATFSNITEQMRSMYRDTMAPHLGAMEATLDMQLRPDFADDSQYAEFLMEEVLRGDFEARSQSYREAIQSGWMKPSEVRKLENLPDAGPFADRLFMNAATIPIDEVSSRTSPNPPAEDVPGAAPAVPEPQPVGAAPQRALPAAPAGKALTAKQLRDLMSRLGRVSSLNDVDPKALTAGLNGAADAVFDAWLGAEDLTDLRGRLRAITEV